MLSLRLQHYGDYAPPMVRDHVARDRAAHVQFSRAMSGERGPRGPLSRKRDGPAACALSLSAARGGISGRVPHATRPACASRSSPRAGRTHPREPHARRAGGVGPPLTPPACCARAPPLLCPRAATGVPSQFEDADEEEVGAVRVPVARTLLRQEAAKYGSAAPASTPAVATKHGGLFPAYGQDRYTPVLPTETADARFGGLDDVYELSGSDPRFHDDTEEEAGEEEDEDEYSDDDGADGDLMWFDGHEGVSGDFTKTFKAEVAGNRPNSAATQANVLLARARRQAGENAPAKLDKQQLLRKFQPSSVRNAKAFFVSTRISC